MSHALFCPVHQKTLRRRQRDQASSLLRKSEATKQTLVGEILNPNLKPRSLDSLNPKPLNPKNLKPRMPVLRPSA